MKSEQRAILTQQVRRVKPSLAGMSYRLEPGEVIYITQWLGRSVRASEVSDQMLTEAGVPEWVMNSENEGVPANATPARLRWYLARHKNVKPYELDANANFPNP